MRRRGCKNRGGFSLAEAMIATVILGVASAGVLLPFTSGSAIRAEGMHRTLAAKLAADMVEEIVSTDFDQITTLYGTYSEAQGHMVKDFETAAEFTDSLYTAFSRDASCVLVYMPPQESAAQAPNFIRATVRVYYNGREIAIINRLISQ